MELLIYLAQRTANSVSKCILYLVNLAKLWFYLYEAYLTTVGYEMPKRQIAVVFIPSGKTIARLTELKISYYFTYNYNPGSQHGICI